MNYVTNMTATTASTPDRLPEVQGEVERIGYGLEGVQKLVDQLESRLSPILAQRAVGGQTENSPEPVRVPLADVLHQRVLLIDAICRQLQGMIERVEL